MTSAPPPYVGIYGPPSDPYAGASGPPPPGIFFTAIILSEFLK